MKKLLLTAMTVLMAVAAQADDDIRLGEPKYGGTGCPAGSAAVALSPDQKELSVLFDSYTLQAGGSSPSTIDRKNCQLAIPVRVPQGYSVSFFQVDYRGFNSLPRNAYSKLDVTYFFAGSRGVRAPTKMFRGPLEGNYLTTDNLLAEAVVWSRCGDDTILRLNTAMFLSNNTSRDALSTVDSIDLSSGLIYKIQWRRCS